MAKDAVINMRTTHDVKQLMAEEADRQGLSVGNLIHSILEQRLIVQGYLVDPATVSADIKARVESLSGSPTTGMKVLTSEEMAAKVGTLTGRSVPLEVLVDDGTELVDEPDERPIMADAIPVAAW